MDSNNYSEDLARAFGYMTLPEIRVLKQIARNLPVVSPIIVNIGAGSGTSSLALREAREDAELYSIDISPGGPMGGFEGENNAFAVENQKIPTQILSSSHEAARQWHDDLKIDLIFIDDGHHEPDIRGDINLWLPRMKDNGIVVFHDYNTAVWPAVTKVVDELMAKYKRIARTDHVVAFSLGEKSHV